MLTQFENLEFTESLLSLLDMIGPQQFPFITVILAPSCSHYCQQS